MKQEKPRQRNYPDFLGQNRVCVEGGYRGILFSPHKEIGSSLKHSHVRKEDGAGTTCHFTFLSVALSLSVHICVGICAGKCS